MYVSVDIPGIDYLDDTTLDVPEFYTISSVTVNSGNLEAVGQSRSLYDKILDVQAKSNEISSCLLKRHTKLSSDDSRLMLYYDDDSKVNVISEIKMSLSGQIDDIEYVNEGESEEAGYFLKFSFTDGRVKYVDLGDLAIDYVVDSAKYDNDTKNIVLKFNTTDKKPLSIDIGDIVAPLDSMTYLSCAKAETGETNKPHIRFGSNKNSYQDKIMFRGLGGTTLSKSSADQTIQISSAVIDNTYIKNMLPNSETWIFTLDNGRQMSADVAIFSKGNV